MNWSVAALFVDGDVAVGEDLGAVLDGGAAVLALEHDAADLRGGVLQGEVDVAARGLREVGDLALDPEAGELEVGLEDALDVADEGADGEVFDHGAIVSWKVARDEGEVALTYVSYNGRMTSQVADELEFTPASAADMPFIAETTERFRLDAERLEPEQFITVRKDGRIIAFGRIKPYEHTYELGSVGVVEEERSQGLGRLVTQELIRRFPQDEVYITTDLPEYYERDGLPADRDRAAGARGQAHPRQDHRPS